MDSTTTFAGPVTAIVPSTGGEPTGPMMYFTASTFTRRVAAVVPPWAVYWSSYMIIFRV